MTAEVDEPTLYAPTESHRGVMVWRWSSSMAVLSSAPVGGGFRSADWLLNVGVRSDYDRTDLSDHCGEIAAALDLKGDGVALFTAANVADWRRHAVGGVTSDATVGISKPTWAADPGGGWTPWQPGTINLVVQIDRPLGPAAAVNAVMTATEAKSQAIVEAGVPGTGTASDAVVIVWPMEQATPSEQFAGPRSPVGSQIAQSVYGAVSAGIPKGAG